MKKITEQKIDIYKERKTSRILEEYYSHRRKSFDAIVNYLDNIELAIELNELLKDDQDNINLIHGKKVALEYCLRMFKTIKSEFSESEEAYKKMKNHNIEDLQEKVEIDDTSSKKTNDVHEEIKLVLKKYYEVRGC